MLLDLKEKEMKQNRFMLSIVTLVVVCFMVPRVSLAASLPLATFSQQNKDVKPFVYTNTGSNPPYGSMYMSSGTNVIFNFVTGNLASSLLATMTLSSNAVDSATVSGPFTYQNFGDFTTAFTYAGPLQTIAGVTYTPGTNLLTMVSTVQGFPPAFYTPGATLSGSNGTTSPSIGGGTATGQVISYTSDYVPNINGGNERDFNISLTSLYAPSASVNGLYVHNVNLYPFTAIISGNYGYSVPEPGVISLLLGVGVSGSMFGFKLRRRRSIS
jgi:hypothetical protein